MRVRRCPATVVSPPRSRERESQRTRRCQVPKTFEERDKGIGIYGFVPCPEPGRGFSHPNLILLAKVGVLCASTTEGLTMTKEPPPKARVGLIQVYTGDGKGKTTAALGLALRAAGHGLCTYIGQFLKGRPYGEQEALKRLAPEVTLEQYGLNSWVHVDRVTPEQREAAREGLVRARHALLSGEYDIVVLDEVNVALHFGVLTEEEVLKFIDDKPSRVELVLTGRRAPQAIIERADLVTKMKEVRHPYHRGIPARLGIEF